MPSHSRLHLLTLGRLALVSPDAGPAGISESSAKLLAILAYLASVPGRRASRDQMVDLFFSDSAHGNARNALRQALHKLREALGTELIASGQNHDIVLGPALTTDRDDFYAALDRGDLQAALDFYGGPFAPGIVSVGSAGFEQWADQERDRLHSLFANAAEEVGRDALRRGDARAAMHLATRMLAHDPLDERAWRLRLESERLGASAVHLAASIEELLQRSTADGRELTPRTRELIALLRQPRQTLDDDASHPALAAELVGRRREFGELYDAWRAAAARRGGHLHITANAGCGKSRLLADFAVRLRTEARRAVLVGVTPHQRTLPYAALGALADAVSQLPGAAAVAPAVLPILVGLQPRISERFRGAIATSGADAAETERLRTEAVADLLQAVSADGPVAILLDDLHWWDAVSRRVLQRLLEHTAGAPLLIVTTSRPGEGEITSSSGPGPIRLAPLTVDEIAELIQSLGSCDQQAAAMLATGLHPATEGVPLLVLEALRLGIDRQQLALDGERWEVIAPAEFIASLHPGSLLGERIRGLTPEQWELLLLAATIELPVGVEQLKRAGLAANEADLLYLERHGLLAPRAGKWVVAHDAIGETAVAMADHSARQFAHARAGQIRLTDADDDAALRGAARHFQAAGATADGAKVAERWLRRRRSEADRAPALGLLADLFGVDRGSSWLREVAAGVPRAARRRPLHPAWKPLTGVAVVAVLAAAWWGRHQPVDTTHHFLLVADSANKPVGYDVSWTPTPAGSVVPGRLRLRHARISAALAAAVRDNATPVFDPFDTMWVAETETDTAGAVGPDPDGPTELVLHTPHGTRDLAPAHGDDVTPSWSPDGRQIVFATTRYPDGGGTFDLAIVSVATGVVRRLTTTPDIEVTPAWSPDGSRIAFLRVPITPGALELCWVAVDNRQEQCRSEPGQGGKVIGWLDAHTVLITEWDGTQLWAVDLEDGTHRIIAHHTGGDATTLGPGRQWIASQAGNRTESTQLNDLVVIRAADPGQLFRIPITGTIHFMVWGRPAVHDYVDRTVIGPDRNVIPGGSPFHLQAVAFSSAGDTVPAPAATLEWSTSDSTVATVDANGIVTPHRDGNVSFTVTDGGWRTGTIHLSVVGQTVSRVLDETWDSTWPSRWTAFGQPRPFVVSAGGTRSLFPNGDDTYSSGVYTTAKLDGHRGLAVEALIRTRLTRALWQQLRLGLEAIDGFGHDGAAGGSGCSFAYPPSEGGAGTGILGFNGSLFMQADSAIRNGAWYRLRIQLFPDGTCGYAINGRVAAHSATHFDVNRPMSVTIDAQTYHADIFVGPLMVWEGVPPGVDWTQPGMATDSG